jgi:hypothetical protein
MATHRWLDRTQPQTLVMATLLLYINAALGVLTLELLVFPVGTIVVVAEVASAWGIANEKKLGYWLGVAAALVGLGFTILYFSFGAVLSLIFWAALVGLLLHPQSREYRRVWFK